MSKAAAAKRSRDPESATPATPPIPRRRARLTSDSPAAIVPAVDPSPLAPKLAAAALLVDPIEADDTADPALDEPRILSFEQPQAPAQMRPYLTKRAIAFVQHYVESGQMSPLQSAIAVGYTRPDRARHLVDKFRDVIDAEAVRRRVGREMELTEALKLTAEVARDSGDRKTQIPALRTILEVHGALSGKAQPVDRSQFARDLESVIGAIKGKLAGVSVGTGSGSTTRARVQVGASIDIEHTENGKKPND